MMAGKVGGLLVGWVGKPATLVLNFGVLFLYIHAYLVCVGYAYQQGGGIHVLVSLDRSLCCNVVNI